MKTHEQLLEIATEISHSRDYELLENINKLVKGDESVRTQVERAIEQIESDAAKHAE